MSAMSDKNEKEPRASRGKKSRFKSLGEQSGEHGEEGRAEEEEEEDLKSVLTVYDPDDFISGAIVTPDSSIPVDLFEFEHSYGYNCHKYFNLCACDESIICWSAGSILTFMDTKTTETWFKRSSTGGTIGSVTSYRKDPNYRIAVAEDHETEVAPIIIIYTWPEMNMDAVLRDGTANAYSIMDFSPDGELLGSVGKEPDYNITIWNWKQHKILLRTSAFTFDVNTIFFSRYCEGQLTTAGAAHIKFWKMAETFTGLKLKGELGRFGKTEICDVLGVYPMPDENVLSGCEWGNILVWEAGLVKVEVTQRGRKRCHGAPIIQFMLSEAGDEVTTISRDGCIRAWYWDTVDQADPPEDDPYIELNPVAETCVPDCQIMCLKHQEGMYWYGQDGNGGIWLVDIEIDKIQCDHKKLMTCHAGGIVAMVLLRTHKILMTAGQDGALMAYDTETHKLVARYVFPMPITALLYPDTTIDPSSRILLVGFADGVMRTILLTPDKLEEEEGFIEVHIKPDEDKSKEEHEFLVTTNILKPHSKAVRQITINEQHTLLVTCGDDCTIFIYRIELKTPFELNRLGYIDTPNNVAYMTWKPEAEYVLLLCCQVGLVMEVVLPNLPVKEYTDLTTFKLEFESFQETLVKKHYMRHRPFPEEEDLASIDEEALKAKELAEQEKKDDEEEEWLGEVELMESESMLGTTITWAQYWDDAVWVIQKGTGCLIQITPGSNKILKFAPIPGAWCDNITCVCFICDYTYIVIGTNTGYIRVLRMPTEEEDNPEYHLLVWMEATKKLLKQLKGRRLAKEEKQPVPRIDFVDYYYLAMHDSYTGAITHFEFSADGANLFTCGMDGNIFSYKIHFPEPLVPAPEESQPMDLSEIPQALEPPTLESGALELLSHEQQKQKEEYDKMMAIAAAHKRRVRLMLAEITADYNKVIKANRLLPVSQQIDVTLDTRPLEVQEQELDDMMKLTIRKLAHQLEASDLGLFKMVSRNIIQLDVYPFTVRAISDPKVTIRPFRQKNLSQAFYDQLQEVYDKMAEAALRGRRVEIAKRKAMSKKSSYGPPRVASFLLGLPPNYPHPLKKALRNYFQRLHRHHLQFIEWQEHLLRKPDPNALPPGAAEALKEAEETIGNKVLKTHPDYVAPVGHNTQLRLCETRKEVYDIKHEFNLKVLKLREDKVRLIQNVKKIHERLTEIRAEIPHALAKTPPLVPEIDDNIEFPEKNLEVTPEDVTSQVKVAFSGRSNELKERKGGIYPQARVRASRVPAFVPLAESKPLTASWELLKFKPGDPDVTPVEMEIRERRVSRHLYEQDMLILDSEAAVKEFDQRLASLQRQRIRVQEKNQLLELFLYQLHLEMSVLNRFESHEDNLAEKVYVKLMQVRGVQEQIAECEHRIEEHKNEKETLGLTCEDLQRQFKKMVQDHKFADFLRRIFKKKYKPPRDRDPDDSESSESSSSSSEEEEEGSIDSRDIGPIRLDPNICPEGCDQETYDLTFTLRDNRHKFEQDMIEQDRLVDLLRRDIDAHNKIKKKLTIQLDKRKNNLKEFMMEKQNSLNEVESTIILRYDQIRASALKLATSPKGLADTVVFPEQTLLRLRKRVLELQEEIELQRQRHKVNRTHLHRMNVDIKFMEARAEELRAQMRDVLTKKLGKPRKVDKTLDDLLRQMTKRHKLNSNLGTIPQMLEDIRKWKVNIDELEKKYLGSLERYSNKLRLAAALQAEIFPLRCVMKTPGTMPGGYSVEDYKRDVVRLRIIRSQQRAQIKTLQEEIRIFRLKPAAPGDHPPMFYGPPREPRSRINLVEVPFCILKPPDYFPIAPLGASHEITDINLMKLLFDCMDAFKVSRDDADLFLKETSKGLPDILKGKISRYEAIDNLMKRWSMKHGGDPTLYKQQTEAFDAIASLLNKMIANETALLEKESEESVKVMGSLESALRDMTEETRPLHQRLGPVLGALMLHAGDMQDLKTVETMTSLVNSLVSDKTPITVDAYDKIDIGRVVADIQECGIDIPEEEITDIVKIALNSLKAQLLTTEEKRSIENEAEQAITDAESQSQPETKTARTSISIAMEPKKVSSSSLSRGESQASVSKTKKKRKVTKSDSQVILEKLEAAAEDRKDVGGEEGEEDRSFDIHSILSLSSTRKSESRRQMTEEVAEWEEMVTIAAPRISFDAEQASIHEEVPAAEPDPEPEKSRSESPSIDKLVDNMQETMDVRSQQDDVIAPDDEGKEGDSPLLPSSSSSEEDRVEDKEDDKD